MRESLSSRERINKINSKLNYLNTELEVRSWLRCPTLSGLHAAPPRRVDMRQSDCNNHAHRC